MLKSREAYEFERNEALYKTRNTQGIVNRLIPAHWCTHSDQQTQIRSIESVRDLVRDFERPVVVAIGAGGGSLFRVVWKEPNVTRIGIDINHDVLVKEGKQHFQAVEGNACLLPLRDSSVDIVLFDYVLHHLVGQGEMENSISEAWRVLRPGGYVIAREPSSFSLSGLALNLANRFRLMNAIAGASNYEFAISPRYLLQLFGREGTLVELKGLSFLWSRRLPIGVQELIIRLEPLVFRSQRSHWLADFIIYIVRKNQQL
jgi:SAM-dependent methyltransferase